MINRLSSKNLKALSFIFLFGFLSNQALARSGGIFEEGEVDFDRSIGCANSNCHASPSATSTIGFLTFASQANLTGSINDTTLKLGKTYTLRMHNSDTETADAGATPPLDGVTEAGFSLSTEGRNGTFTAGSNTRIITFPVVSTGLEITHTNASSVTWEFSWTPAQAGTDNFEWCTQKVNGNGIAVMDVDGPYDCGTQAFSVEANAAPVVTANSTQTFLVTSASNSRQIIAAVTDSNEGDEATMTYQWSPTTNLSDATVLNPTYLGNSQQTYTLTATDEFGTSASSGNIAVDIDPIPEAIISNLPGSAVLEGTNVTVSGVDSTDKNNSNNASNIANYSWRLLDPSGTSIANQSSVSNSFTISVADIPLGQTLDYTVELTVTDSAGQNSSAVQQTVRFKDEDADTPAPSITQINISGSDASDIHNEGETITLAATVNDGTDPIAALWTQLSAPPTITLSGTGFTRQFQVDVTDANAAGPLLEFQLSATDSRGQFDTDTVSIQINNGPTAAAGQDATVNEGDTVTLDGTASSDPDDIDPLTFTWTQTAGLPVTLVNPATATPEFEATNIAPAGSVVEFQLTVTDKGLLVSTDTVQITINNVNTGPVASAGNVQTVTEGELTTLNGSGSIDDDADTLTYNWIQTAGTGVSLNDAGLIMPTFTAPSVGFDGDPVLTFELTVTDSENLISSASVMVNVSNDNMAPIANAGPTQNVPEGSQVTLNGNSSTDPDLAEDDALTFAWVKLSGDAGLELENADTATPTFTAPLVDPAGLSATYELTVTDRGQLVDTDQTVVNILNENQPPRADAGQDQAAMGGATVQLDGSSSQDPDAALASQSWVQIAGPAVALVDPSALQTSFIAPPAANTPTVLTWRLTVVGNEGLQDQDEVTITIARTNSTPPVANAGPDQSAVSGDRVMLDGSASTDADTAELAFSWRQIGLQTVMLINPTSATPEFVVADAGETGTTFVFELTVTDEDALTATDQVEISAIRAGELPPPLIALLPGVRTVVVNTAASAFVSAINTGDELLEGCSIATDTPFSGSLNYQTTNPATNALTGTPQTPASIAPGATQSFVIGIVPSAVFSQTELSFTVDCTNSPKARSVSGLSTLLLSSTGTPTADVVALAVTPSGDGVVRLPGAGSSAAFGAASFNLGSTAILQLAVDAPENLPLDITVCETNPATAACVAPPVREINTNSFRNGSASYSIFVTATGAVAFDPETSRITVRFMEGDVVRGATSVAVTTE